MKSSRPSPCSPPTRSHAGWTWLAALAPLLACAPTIGFSSPSDTVELGGTVTLEWRSSASACTLEPGVGPVEAAGSVTLSPTETTTYRLSCGGAVSELTITVRPKPMPDPDAGVGAVRITSFTSSPTSVTAGASATLRWTTERATSCELSPGSAVPPSGSLDVSPTQTTGYRLTCQGPQGPATAQLELVVTPASTDAGQGEPTLVTASPEDAALEVRWVLPAGATAATLYLAESPGLTRSNVPSLDGGVVFPGVTSPFRVTGLVNERTYSLRVGTRNGGQDTPLSLEVSAQPRNANPQPDPHEPDQWHHHNVGQQGGTAGEDIRVNPVWSQGLRGEGIRVALVDDGMDHAHEDLWRNLATGQSHAYVDAPVRLTEHGTACGGLIAARDQNGLGGRGVAPRANLVTYNLLQDSTSANGYDAMTRNAPKVFVSSNSWGDADDGTGLLTEADSDWLRGVQDGVRLGRNGLGTVYVWPSGNGGDATTEDDANYDRQSNQRFTISVSGVGDDGKKASYSEDGACVVVTAPTGGRADHGLFTTDITGAPGYNDGTTSGEPSNAAYTNSFNGTSGSTPVVAGVVALVLQANPRLTWRDVRRVLAYSARKNDALDADWTTNGAGLHVNHKYGFGIVDAQAAVATARTFVPGAPEVRFTAPLVSPNAALADNSSAAVSSSVSVTSSGITQLEWVEVTATVTHARSGDVELVLEHGGGTRSVLHRVHTCADDEVTMTESCSDIDAYTFASVRHLDEPGNGTWTLKARDGRSGTTGRLVSWRLTLFGRP